MTSYNCDVNSYFLLAVDVSHKTITYINFHKMLYKMVASCSQLQSKISKQNLIILRVMI